MKRKGSNKTRLALMFLHLIFALLYSCLWIFVKISETTAAAAAEAESYRGAVIIRADPVLSSRERRNRRSRRRKRRWQQYYTAEAINFIHAQKKILQEQVMDPAAKEKCSSKL